MIHLFRYYHTQALCKAQRSLSDAHADRVDRVPSTTPTCMACIALRLNEGEPLYAHPAALVATYRCYVTKDGIAHAPAPAPQLGWYFRLCDEVGGGNTIYAIESWHLKEVPVTCLECLDAMSERDM